MKTVPIELTELERWALAKLASERNANKERHGVRTRKVDNDLSDEEMHYIGLKAEYAIAKLLGVDFNPENMLSGDGGTDIIYRGLTVDVKYSQLDLKFRPGTFLADVAILTQPLQRGSHRYAGKVVSAERDSRVSKRRFAWANILVVGWVSRERFESEHVIRNFGYNDVEFMAAGDLSPLKGLRDHAKAISGTSIAI